MNLSTKLILATFCLAICISPALAFWRLPCAKPITIERVDPIVSFGTVGEHVHTVMGSSAFHSKATPESIRKAQCSTCLVKQDNSNYWIANLWFQHADGTVEPVEQEGGMLVYYLQRPGHKGEKIHAFPPGLRMVAGDPEKREGGKSHESHAISYACVNYAHASPETGAFPQKSCPQGLRVQVFFPSCWDGKNLDSADHKSHMAYPTGMNTGECPKSHPVHLISIFYEVYYRAAKFDKLWLDNNGKPFRAMPFVWSTGDNTGFGHHGDFMNGWDTETLQRAVDDCTSMSGVVQECRHFQFRSNEDANACKLEYQTEVEDHIQQKMQQIPNVGKIPVARFDPCGHSPNQGFDDTEKGPLGTCKGRYTGKPAYTPVQGHHMHMGNLPNLPPAKKAAPPVDQVGYIGCFKDGDNQRGFEKRVDGGDRFTPATCRKAVKALGREWQAFAIQFGGECWASKSRDSFKQFGTSDNCKMDCRSDPLHLCGGPKANQAYYVNA